MKEVMNIEQNTKAWHDLRRNGVGASDVAAILGISPYKTRHDIFLSKTTDEVQNTSFIQQRGHDKELIARAKYEINTGEEYPPCLVENDIYSYMRASLDGWNKEKNHIIEIKYCGKNFKEEIPEHYNVQCQYQMFLTGGTCELVWITDDDKIKCVPIERDLELIKKIISEVIAFWDEVKNAQYVECISEEKINLLKLYKEKNSELKKIEEEVEKIKNDLLKDLDKKDYETQYGAIRWVEKKGNIDYGKIPELNNVDLEQYRKKSSRYWSIK